MTTLAAGSSVTVAVRDGGTVAIATNGGLASAVVSPTEGGSIPVSLGPLSERRTLGPYKEGASVVITNASCGAFDYDVETMFDPSSVAITGGAITGVKGDFVSVKAYGAVGDGIADDTAAVQAAVNACSAAKKVLLVPTGNYLLSGAGLSIPANFPGIVGEGIFRTIFYYIGSGTGITLTSGGALGVYRDWQITAGNVGDSVATARATARNGIYWKCYGGQGEVRNIKATNFNGFGQKFEALWDSVCPNLVTESCGSAAEYAFSVINGTDLANHSIFDRLQVELSYTKALFLDGLNNVFTGLHSERTTGDGASYTHIMQGDITVINGRIEATTNVYCKVGIAVGSLKDVKFNSGNVDFNWASRLTQPAKIVGCTFAGNVSMLGTNLRHYEFDNCSIAGTFTSLYPEKDTTLNHTTVAGNVTLTSTGTKLVVRNYSTIGGTITSGGGTNYCDVIDSSLAFFPAIENVMARSCTVSGAHSTPFAQKAYALDCTFSALVTIANNNVKWKSDGCNYAAGVTLGAGSPGWGFGPRDYAGAAVSAGFNAAPLGGAWNLGERGFNLTATVGQAKSRVCTVAGTPGTWVSEGNL